MSPQLITEKVVTARVRHQCQTCNRPAAEPGGQYTRETYVYDGRVYNWVQCQPCRGILVEVHAWSSSDWGVGADEYAEWADEHATDDVLGDLARAHLARLTPASTQGAHDA